MPLHATDDPFTITLMGGLEPGPTASAVREGLEAEGVLGAFHALGDDRFAPCRGCFGCWIDTPGTCAVRDDANDVMRDIINADAVLWTTRVTSGCWHPVTKAALDRSIGLLSPFFRKMRGETHHVRRYRHYPRWGVLAVTEDRTTEAERALFARLVARNALNLHAGTPWVGFVPADATPGTVRTAVAEAVAALRAPHGEVPEPFPELAPAAQRPDARGIPPQLDRPRHITLWIGSAKPTGESTSEALGRALVARLEDRGWTAEPLYSARAVRLKRRRDPRLVAAVRRADLVVLASPVYVDALPALVLEGFQAIERDGLGGTRPALLPIVNCGFPELQHTALAVEIAALAAGRAGMDWAGHLALGGGGMIDGRSLESLGGRAHAQAEALDAAAEALDAGRPIPQSVADRFADAPISDALYRLAGQAGWLVAAAEHGALADLWKRPFDEG